MSDSPNSGRPLTRQELYDRIRETSKSQYILEEMVRLGFWGKDSDAPVMTKDWVEKRGELTRELQQLLKQQKRYENKEAALKAMRKERMADALRRREETKQKRKQEREARASAWQEKQEKDIVYLGEGVSGGLSGDETGDPSRRQNSGAPDFASLPQLAQAMGRDLKELRFLAYHRRVSKTTHYKRFFMPKKSGGERLISAPMPRLKSAQHWILENILGVIPVHDAAHGFVPGRSIVTNAACHVGRSLVVNWDLKNFFPTVTYPRVKGMFKSLGYPEKVATVLALICTEPDADEVELDGERYFVHTSERHLPQGAPTSPAITNILCRKFDARLQGSARSLGYTYSRYADDMTFSASDQSSVEKLNQLIWRVRAVVGDEGFEIHPDKLRIMRKGGRQEVTGLTVNEKLGVPKPDLRRFRALVFQIEKDGPTGKRWRGSGSHILACIYGYANFICMVDGEKGAPIKERVDRILVKHGWKHEIRHAPKPAPQPIQSAPKESRAQPVQNSGRKKSFWDRLKFWKK